MPDLKPASPTDTDIMDFSDAPGGDIALDDLFGADGQPAAPTTATTPDPTPAPVTNQPAIPDFFLDAGTSKYKTQEEAIRGFAHKDEVIEHLRGIAVQATGIDPLTGQKVAVPRPQSSGTSPYGQPYQDDSYLNNPAKYSSDLRKAVSSNDETAYLNVQKKLAQEQMMQQFAPVAPLIQQFAVQSAVASVTNKQPEFKAFYNTPEYTKALDARPLLKSAIQAAEQNFELQAQLPELYELAYQVSQVQKMSDLVKAQSQPTTPSVRPTTPASRLTPPAASNGNANWRTNPDVAKALVDEYERKMGF
jgi:hypothetical protein